MNTDEKLARIKKALVDANLELKNQKTEKQRVTEEEITNVLKLLPAKISGAAKRGQRVVIVKVSSNEVAKAINDDLKKVGIISATVSGNRSGLFAVSFDIPE